ncbi:hypothetical protein F4803DRAFT_504568 [Xylaria telfairii]|nr:hypothetical protein F4803DRAFT_504568 [Xylaria telfairii]
MAHAQVMQTNELLNMVAKFVVMGHNNPKNRHFWFISEGDTDHPYLATPTTCGMCEFGPTRVSCRKFLSEEAQRAPYKCYETSRGSMIRELLLVHRSMRGIVMQYYTFLKPYQANNAMSPPPGYWVYPEYDVFRPASSLNFEPSISSSSPYAFSWSRVKNLHLALGSLMRPKLRGFRHQVDYQTIIRQLPMLEHVCILQESDHTDLNLVDEVKPHIITTGTLSRVERTFKLEDQVSLGLEPPNVLGALSEEKKEYSEEVKEILRWCQSRKVTIVELANTDPHCLIHESGRRWDHITYHQNQLSYGLSQVPTPASFRSRNTAFREDIQL